jgi:hypothetical protein
MNRIAEQVPPQRRVMETPTLDTHHEPSRDKLVIIGSTPGTLFEWYDFFLYGAVASVFSKQFFASLSSLLSVLMHLSNVKRVMSHLPQ